jgi:hypothetical protein
MTKVEAIQEVMRNNSGTASWKDIYDNIEQYHPSAKASAEWEAGIRGVLYRELKEGHRFKKIGLGIFALSEYQENNKLAEIKNDQVRMHSYMEGIMIELGNYENFNTYCADPSTKFQDNIAIKQITTLDVFPDFTYPEINNIARRIDVIWFSKKGYKFPKRVIEVVDSINTLGESLNRMYQLKEFQTDFYILAPEKHIDKIHNTVGREPYSIEKERFIVKTYDDAIAYYKSRIELEKVRF